MLAAPEIIATDVQEAAVIRLTIPRSEMMKVFGPAVGELMAALAAQGVEPVGAVFAHHLKMSPDTFDFELVSNDLNLRDFLHRFFGLCERRDDHGLSNTAERCGSGAANAGEVVAIGSSDPLDYAEVAEPAKLA